MNLRSWRPWYSAMSAPATKAFSPAPVRIRTRTAGSASTAASSRSKSVRSGVESAFSFSGRLKSRKAPSSRAGPAVRRRPSHHPAGAEVRALLGRVAELLQDRIGVLAHDRRDEADRARRLAEQDRDAHHLDAARPRVVDLPD